MVDLNEGVYSSPFSAKSLLGHDNLVRLDILTEITQESSRCKPWVASHTKTFLLTSAKPYSLSEQGWVYFLFQREKLVPPASGASIYGCVSEGEIRVQLTEEKKLRFFLSQNGDQEREILRDELTQVIPYLQNKTLMPAFLKDAIDGVNPGFSRTALGDKDGPKLLNAATLYSIISQLFIDPGVNRGLFFYKV